jgi:hypothetical protein
MGKRATKPGVGLTAYQKRTLTPQGSGPNKRTPLTYLDPYATCSPICRAWHASILPPPPRLLVLRGCSLVLDAIMMTRRRAVAESVPNRDRQFVHIV